MKRALADSRRGHALAMAEPPVVARVLRGGRLESSHRGLAAIVAAGGRLLGGLGEAGRPRADPLRGEALPGAPAARGRRRAGLSSGRRRDRPDVRLARRRAAARSGRATASRARRVSGARSRLRRAPAHARAVGARPHPPRRADRRRPQQLLREARRAPAGLPALRFSREGLLRALAPAAPRDPRPRGGFLRRRRRRNSDRRRRLQSSGVHPAAVGPRAGLRAAGRALAGRRDARGGRCPTAGRARDGRRVPTWWPGAAGSRPTFSAPAAGRWIGKEGAEGVYAVGSRRVARNGRRGRRPRAQDRRRLVAPARRRRSLALLERLALLSDRARSALSGYRFPADPQRPRTRRRLDRSGSRPGRVRPSRAATMAYRNLSAFLDALERDGDLARVRARVSRAAGDRGDRRPGRQGRRAGPPLRERGRRGACPWRSTCSRPAAAC